MSSVLPRSFAEAAVQPSSAWPLVRLPYPYYTSYRVTRPAAGQHHIVLHETQIKGESLSVPLHHSALTFSDLDESSSGAHSTSNTAWARARRSPAIALSWTASPRPNVENIWLLAYFVFTLRPDIESVRLSLRGSDAVGLSADLQMALLTIAHPAPDPMQEPCMQGDFEGQGELVLLRAAFWQGAGSPAGPRPIWLPPLRNTAGKPLSDFPPIPQLPTLTTRLPPSATESPHEARRVIHAAHPVRPQKPLPGSVLYSRYIPTLGEEFSIVYLDVNDQQHLELFHTWQNDERVSAGWNESGTIEHHRGYLEAIQRDPHQMATLARFDSTYFAYFEFYYALEDHFGPHWTFDLYDRGRHNLVGNEALRGPHRVNAWWPAQVHFLFLDDPRTRNVVGEPKVTSSTVLSYDFLTGFNIERTVDLPHKRSALMRLPRDRFFQLDVSGATIKERIVGGTRVGVNPKL